MKFEWDDAKNALNIEKHSLDFADAGEMFQAPMLTTLDTRFDYGEDRFVGVGLLRSMVAVVIFTESEENTVRLVSLRKATKRERVKYERALKDRLG